MTKVIGPIFSLDAEGNLGKALNYFRRKDVNIVRRLSTHIITASKELENIQGFMRDSVWTWQHLTPNIKTEWNTWASNYMRHASGFNAFTSYYIKDLSIGQTPPLEPPE